MIQEATATAAAVVFLLHVPECNLLGATTNPRRLSQKRDNKNNSEHPKKQEIDGTGLERFECIPLSLQCPEIG